MNDVQDRLERLRRAGRLRRPGGQRQPAPSPPPAPAVAPTPTPSRLRDLRDLPGMEEVSGPAGSFLLRTVRYELSHRQGRGQLRDLLDLPIGAPAVAARDPALEVFDFRRAHFIDTETSGLAGGAGTIVFLTGVGCFEEDAYIVRQYFARHPGEERAYLAHLAGHLAAAGGYVSFNGKSFDLPLLRTRLLLAGLPALNESLPHLDLLHPARRLWRERLGACNFGHLERRVLKYRRSQQDVESWAIPSLWFLYARGEGNVDDMARVLYHNLEDIVSMAPLAYVLSGVFAGHLDPHPGDLLALAHSHQAQGLWAEAETLYRQVLAQPLAGEQQARALAGLAAVLKRQGRRAEAAPHWQAWAGLDRPDAVEACEELAKYHEWETGDLAEAQRWTERALARVATWRRGLKQSQTRADLEHRRARLLQKQGRD